MGGDPTVWDKRELRWVGLEFDPLEPRESDEVDLAMIGRFVGVRQAHMASTLSNGNIVQVYMDATFGAITAIRDRRFNIVGFGIRVNDELASRILLGKANRVLGSIGIDREASTWCQTIFDRAEDAPETV